MINFAGYLIWHKLLRIHVSGRAKSIFIISLRTETSIRLTEIIEVHLLILSRSFIWIQKAALEVDLTAILLGVGGSI